MHIAPFIYTNLFPYSVYITIDHDGCISFPIAMHTAPFIYTNSIHILCILLSIIIVVCIYLPILHTQPNLYIYIYD